MEPEDLNLLYLIENDVSVWNVGATNVPYSRYILHEYMNSITGDIYTDKQVRMMAENADGEVVGIVDLINFSPEHHRAEVGIIIINQFRRQGYATHTLCKILDYARDILRLHQVYAIVDEQNEPSQKTFVKAGFVHETYLKEWLFDGRAYKNAIVMQKIL